MDGDLEAQTRAGVNEVWSRHRHNSLRDSLFARRKQQKPTQPDNLDLADLGPRCAQDRGRNPAPSLYHKAAIDLVFGLPHSCLVQWPGILVFFAYLETKFSQYFDDSHDGANKILSRPSPERGGDRVVGWEWCLAVSRALKDLQRDEFDIQDTSVGSVFDTILQKSDPSVHALTQAETDEAYRAIFACLCWMSMTLLPIKGAQVARSPPQALSSPAPRAWVKGSKQTLSAHSLRRPVARMFRMFRQRVVDQQRQQPQQQQHQVIDSLPSGAVPPVPSTGASEILYQSSLNFFSLDKIGHVRLEWVDTITGHLRFNHQQRILGLFRFPTMCIVNIMGKNGPVALKRITQELLPPEHWMEYLQDDDNGDDQGSTSIHREVLLSYRLIFAQSARSRKLIKQHLDRLGSSSRGPMDPLLVALCSSPLKRLHRDSGLPRNIFPYSAVNEDGTLQESDAYCVGEDFPCLGSRLLVLQRYNMRRQPSKVKDLWRDQRNPLQWYTFWAVLWVGGITVFLTALQLIVGAAQLYYAAVQDN